MWNCSRAAAAALLLTAVSAGAQTAKPESAADAASAAMERARRQAAGPMRVILEASKSRRKGAEADSPSPSPSPPPIADSSVRVVSNRSAPPTPALTSTATPVPTPAPPLAAVASSTAAPTPTPTPTSTAASPEPLTRSLAVVPPAAVAAPAVAARITLISDALQGKGTSAPVPGLEATSAAPVALALGASAPPLPTLGAGPARVKLINRVDPELGQRQLDDMGRNAVVTVDMTIRADGTVAAIALVPPTPRGIQRAVVAALEQWRFEPLPSERLHRVQLLFNRE